MRKKNYVIAASLAVSSGVFAFGSHYWMTHQRALDAESVAPQALPSPPVLTALSTEDITSNYVTNPSFENDDISTLDAVTESADGLRRYSVTSPNGWTVLGNPDKTYVVTKDCYTDNNFGLVTNVSDGSQALYFRMGWSTGSTTISQTLNSLPAGRYQISVDQRSAYANSATSSFSLSAAGQSTSVSFSSGSTDVFTSSSWKTSSVTFTLDSESDVTISININWLSGGSCVMFDNVRLYSVEGEEDPSDNPTEEDVTSPTEGVITSDFVPETEMKADLLQMLANFSTYIKNDFQDCQYPNSIDEECGCFKGENTMGNNEQGVRPNADLSMVCAFLVKYGKDKVELPDNVTWEDLESMAMKSLVFAYSTHKANKLKVCSGGNYWGSTSTSDYVWESSLWAMSVAYSAFFQWDKLSDTQKGYIEALLKAECNYELQRSIPTGYQGDTKAEENGWETNILAATLGLFPNDELAEQWFKRLREFAINCYSHPDDASDNTVIDPDYDDTTVADLYVGQNLYTDYTLQNHNLFHTSYQNVVMQELGESALALKLFQNELYGVEKWSTNALMHNNQKVMDEVLNWLALADGELAMPNGNDWSLFLYDQITSYTTMACFLDDPNALMLENLAYKNIQARQTTTSDGSWLLRADVGARRMGVEAHRVMMTWLMHEVLSTSDITPTNWDDFNETYSDAKILPSQNVVRAATDSRFSCFSWSSGLSSYTGYITSNTPDKNKIIVPYRANNTGNILGYYTVSGKSTNATPIISGIYDLRGNSYVMNGEINTNDASLNNRFAVYSTPGNAYIYVDYVRANSSVTVTSERGGLMAISTDPFTKETRTIYTLSSDSTISSVQSDGTTLQTFNANWANIDNEVGFVSVSDKQMAFGDQAANNSILTSKFYTSYSASSRTASAGDVLDKRNMIYYSSVNSETTSRMAAESMNLGDRVPEGWNGVIASDPDGTKYMLLCNFVSEESCTLDSITFSLGSPVFSELTTIKDGYSSATFKAETNHSVADIIKVFVDGNDVQAVQDSSDSCAAYIQNIAENATDINVNIISNNDTLTKAVNLVAGQSVKVSVENGAIKVEDVDMPADDESSVYEGYTDVTSLFLENPNFELDETYGNTGSVTLSSVTYSPCYTNSVSAISSSFPNILPVEGWTSTNTLSSNSNYARNYSMPYSSTMYCVSPSSVGNYAAQCLSPVLDDSCQARCLTVLNSWTAGINKIGQTINLPAGDYRLLLDMKYECTNESSNNGTTIIASNGNVNTSHTGISYGGTTDYRFPDENYTWQLMVYDFTLEETTDVTIDLGLETSNGVGAANNALLYIDNVRLLSKNTKISVDINDVESESLKYPANMYSIQGSKLKTVNNKKEVNEFPEGIYIVGNKKIKVN